MPTIYNILAEMGYPIDLSNKQHCLFINDLGNHLAAIAKQKYPDMQYPKVFSGYCGNNIPLTLRVYPQDQVVSYVADEITNFIASKNAFNSDGHCIYFRQVKGKAAREQEWRLKCQMKQMQAVNVQ